MNACEHMLCAQIKPVCMNETPHSALAPCHPQVWLWQGEHWPVQKAVLPRGQPKCDWRAAVKLVWDYARTREYPWAAQHLGALSGTTIIFSSAWPTFPSTACEVCQHLCLNMITNKRLLSEVLSFFSPLCQYSFFPLLHALPFPLWGVQSKQQLCIFFCRQL